MSPSPLEYKDFLIIAGWMFFERVIMLGLNNIKEDRRYMELKIIFLLKMELLKVFN